MHYRNGREAKNGDQIVQFDGSRITAMGVLFAATPGADYCNGNIARVCEDDGARLIDCLHVEDLAAILAQAGLDKRPAGK